MMGNCKNCYQFRSIGDSGLCGRCENRKERRKIKYLKLKEWLEGEMLPCKEGGQVASRMEWITFKKEVDKFYGHTRDKKIREINKSIRERLALQKERSRKRTGFIYLIRSNTGHYKIGRTTNLDLRIKSYSREYPIKTKVIHSFKCDDYVNIDSYLLRKFQNKQLQGEWFDLSDSDIEWIKNLDGDIVNEWK